MLTLTPDEGIFLIRVDPVANHSLLRSNIANVSIYEGSINELDTVLAWINAKCETERKADGSLTAAGIYKKQLLDHLYRLNESTTECEYIEGLPTRRQFFDLVSHSKPFIFKGALHQAGWPAMKKWTTAYLR